MAPAEVQPAHPSPWDSWWARRSQTAAPPRRGQSRSRPPTRRTPSCGRPSGRRGCPSCSCD
eukprot:scaffold4501_cov72-Phaeocystis_antarctica.AAC.1